MLLLVDELSCRDLIKFMNLKVSLNQILSTTRDPSDEVLGHRRFGGGEVRKSRLLSRILVTDTAAVAIGNSLRISGAGAHLERGI